MAAMACLASNSNRWSWTDIARVISSLAQRGDMAILLVEQCYFARSLADRYIVMMLGQVVRAGAGSDMDAQGVRHLLAVWHSGGVRY